VQNGDVGRFNIVEFLVHVLEYTAVLERHSADFVDMVVLQLLKGLKHCTQGFQQNDGLTIERTCLELVPVQNIQVARCRVIVATLFDHTRRKCIPLETRDLFCTKIPLAP
jgi:hypothetical protein